MCVSTERKPSAAHQEEALEATDEKSRARYGQNGAETFALARVESDANNPAVFRVTAASVDAATAGGVLEAILSQIVP